MYVRTVHVWSAYVYVYACERAAQIGIGQSRCHLVALVSRQSRHAQFDTRVRVAYTSSHAENRQAEHEKAPAFCRCLLPLPVAVGRDLVHADLHLAWKEKVHRGVIARSKFFFFYRYVFETVFLGPCF